MLGIVLIQPFMHKRREMNFEILDDSEGAQVSLPYEEEYETKRIRLFELFPFSNSSFSF